MLSGCAASEKNKDKKADEKVSHKEQDKSESKKKEVEKKAKEVKETTEEALQEQKAQTSQIQETPVATGISSIFTDDELFAFADETVNTFYAERMSRIFVEHILLRHQTLKIILRMMMEFIMKSMIHKSNRIMISKMFIARSFLEDIQSATISHTT